MTFNTTLDSIKTYEAGKPIELVVREYGIAAQNIIKLASNENPRGCSSQVIDAVSKIISNMARYPDDSMYRLKEGLASHYAIERQNIIIGSGSDQVLEFAIHAKVNHSKTVLMNNTTFAMYEIYARHVGAKVVKTTSQHHDLEQFYELYKAHNPAIIFICTPNNPTGDALEREALYAFLDKIDTDTLVIVDGAYMEYTRYKDAAKAIEPKDLIARYTNVLYLGTFSKAYGLGGMRIGYGIANEPIISELYKLRPPFNITTLSLEAATVALQDQEFVLQSMALNLEQMQRYEAFAKAHDLEYIESYTNFVTYCLDARYVSSEIALELLKQGMIVRDLTSYNMNAIRITIGTQRENDKFFELFEKLL